MENLPEIIIDRIEANYYKIVRLSHSVPVSALLEPIFSNDNNWSVKDLLAHIAAWEWRCAGMLNLAQDSNMPFRGSRDVDALNEEIYQERKDWSWEEVETDFRTAHEMLLKAIWALPLERLYDPIVQKSIAEETWEHYEEHLSSLEYWHDQVVSQWQWR